MRATTEPAVFDLTKACYVTIKNVDSATEEETGVARGVVIQYECDMHEGKTIIIEKPEDVAMAAIWLSYHGLMLWGEEFTVILEAANEVILRHHAKALAGGDRS